jgi:hypothetical protein
MSGQRGGSREGSLEAPTRHLVEWQTDILSETLSS